ncbi:hypothetical protein TREMEDRAFT_27309 [Tremella mesenterica DSM 1558]|uniref:uncharacterized protein n=1 Tax=Tremella mesenterica (strain ATCC 24925 / CBS 8224 / DSM 1558 / NBRC 9311 / NRRL Y-6157 / RJB 2259-6 / UBC 559-6) TaxID=578456 RepID=UPI0003F4985C|nr:uncharacterized protein TREMEDRAFT_27309 [Tremella mesenterica DSM 1558]EIW71590.1 hypothetical protein TREMEDRAFT_27309 [Tremella mesenterica DSM 1558]
MDNSIIKSFVESSAAEWTLILSLVFGGCCSNVWALEAVLRDYPHSGTFLTFAQFIWVALQTASSQLVLPPGKGFRLPQLRQRKVPMKRWIVQTVMFVLISLMNNATFGLKIPMVVHIIFRSGGLCMSMLVGRLFAGKRYSFGQIVTLITVGIILATLSAPRPHRPTGPTSLFKSPKSQSWVPEHYEYAVGVGFLSISLVLGSWLGLWQEETYKRYGKQWRESLFYSHFLSIPFFLPLYSNITSTFLAYTRSPPLLLFALPSAAPASIYTFGPHHTTQQWLEWKPVSVPGALVALLVNVTTQGLCIRGVNRLTSRVNATTVNLVLTVRKAISLGISVWYYGSGVTPGLFWGGIMVLCQSLLLPLHTYH